MSARVLIGRLRAAVAAADTAPGRRLASSWHDWHDPRDLELANRLLAELDHHGRTFPTAGPYDDAPIRRAALALRTRTR